MSPPQAVPGRHDFNLRCERKVGSGTRPASPSDGPRRRVPPRLGHRSFGPARERTSAVARLPPSDPAFERLAAVRCVFQVSAVACDRPTIRPRLRRALCGPETEGAKFQGSTSDVRDHCLNRPQFYGDLTRPSGISTQSRAGPPSPVAPHLTLCCHPWRSAAPHHSVPEAQDHVLAQQDQRTNVGRADIAVIGNVTGCG